MFRQVGMKFKKKKQLINLIIWKRVTMMRKNR